MHLGRHCTEQDFEQTLLFLDDADLFLFESSADQETKEMIEDALSGNLEDMLLNELKLETYCLERFRGFNKAALRAIHQKKVNTAIADPPMSHSSIRDAQRAEDIWHPDNPDTYFDLMIKSTTSRDNWLLQNLAKIIDKNAVYTQGERRKVVIFRGSVHFNFLRALEYQIEFNPVKANGSQIVSSVVQLKYHDGNFIDDINFR